MFDPGLDEASAAELKYMRLPTRYNADIGLYVINGNKWSIPTSEIRWASGLLCYVCMVLGSRGCRETSAVAVNVGNMLVAC